MKAPDSREPGYRAGRFFLSPMLGCTARCAFCYTRSFGYRFPSGHRNEYGVDASMAWVREHPLYVAGPAGSIVSIGAWGDPFPPDDADREHTLAWVRAACALGNPVQLMSRFELPEPVLEAVVEAIAYPGQLLYSTSMSSVTRAAEIERYADPPERRLRTLEAFRRRGVPTNVMVKPFIPGVTDADAGEIVALLRRHSVPLCVVGGLYWDDTIARSTSGVAGLEAGALDGAGAAAGSPLDCEPSATLRSLPGAHLDGFVDRLWDGGVAAFKKSACANAYAAGVDLGLRERPEYRQSCVECGACSDSPTPRTPVPVDGPVPAVALPASDAPLRRARELLEAWPAQTPLDLGMRNVFVSRLRSRADALSPYARPVHLSASLVLLDPTATQALLVRDATSKRWGPCEGHWDGADPTLADTALRAAAALAGSTDIRLVSASPVDLDVHAAPCSGDPGVRHHDVRFVGTVAHEVPATTADLAWFAVSDLPPGADDSLARLLDRAVAAVRLGVDGGTRHPRPDRTTLRRPVAR